MTNTTPVSNVYRIYIFIIGSFPNLPKYNEERGLHYDVVATDIKDVLAKANVIMVQQKTIFSLFGNVKNVNHTVSFVSTEAEYLANLKK